MASMNDAVVAATQAANAAARQVSRAGELAGEAALEAGRAPAAVVGDAQRPIEPEPGTGPTM